MDRPSQIQFRAEDGSSIDARIRRHTAERHVSPGLAAKDDLASAYALLDQLARHGLPDTFQALSLLVEQHLALMDTAKARLRFTVPQALLLCAALQSVDATHLAAVANIESTVRDACARDRGASWGVDLDALVARIEQLGLVERLALLDGVACWHHDQAGTPAERLVRAGLIPPHEPSTPPPPRKSVDEIGL